MTLIASMLLLSSTTYAVEMSNSHAPKQMMAMSKADAQQMLDKAGIDMSKAKVLDNGEMVKTEGENWLTFGLRLGYTGARVAWRNFRTGGRTYRFGNHRAHHNFGTRRNPSWRRHFQWNTTHGTYRVPYGRHYPLKYGK